MFVRSTSVAGRPGLFQEMTILNKSCKKKPSLAFSDVSRVIYGFGQWFLLKLFGLYLRLHVISGAANKAKNSSKWNISETLWTVTLACKTNPVGMKNTSDFLGWQLCSKKENEIHNKRLIFFFPP